MFDRFNAWAAAFVGRLENDKGQTFVEYALILAVVVVGLLLAYTTTDLGGAIDTALGHVSDALSGVTGG